MLHLIFRVLRYNTLLIDESITKKEINEYLWHQILG